MKIKPAKRTCLTCGVTFRSTGPGNRRCGKCNLKVKDSYRCRALTGVKQD